MWHMKLSDWLDLERGRGALLAKAIGAPSSVISQWATEKRIPPFLRCVAIERETGGDVTRRELRPDDFLEMWPELSITGKGKCHSGKCAAHAPEKSAVLPGCPPVTNLQTIPAPCNDGAAA